MPRWFVSELVGTFILVFFGCGSVATSFTIGAAIAPFEIAAVWGLALALAIYLTGSHSGAHLNPAITLAFALFRSFPRERIAGYMAAQFLGAFVAAAAVYLVFGVPIANYESANLIARGTPGSEASAMVFGEFFPNPGGNPLSDSPIRNFDHGKAIFAEFLGTAFLALAIFGFTARGNRGGPGILTPLAIGMTLTVLISVLGPLTMAGLNPARDFGPRLFSSLAGWGSIPFTTNGMGWLTVYIVAPCLGAFCGGFLASYLFQEKCGQ